MTIYNMLEAKNNLSKICKLLQEGEEDYIVIANNGKPVARIFPFSNDSRNRIGILEHKYQYNDSFDEYNDEINKLFFGD